MRAFIAMLATAVLLAGCANGSNSSSSDDANEGARAVAPGSEAGARAAAPRVVDDGAVRKNLPIRPAPAQAPAASHAIVYTADLTMQAKDVGGAAARAKQIVTAAGGYVSDERASSSPDSPPSATITFKIPSARYAMVLDQLGSARIGRRLSLRQHTEDVTQEIADVDSRVESAKAALASFRKLLAKATSIADILRVEEEISQREADLESLQARQRSLNRQTAYATVTLRLDGPTAMHKKGKAGGFLGGLAAGWRAFTGFLGGVALVLGWLLPFLIFAVLIGLPGAWLWRRRRAGSPDAPTSPGPPADPGTPASAPLP